MVDDSLEISHEGGEIEYANCCIRESVVTYSMLLRCIAVCHFTVGIE